MTTSTLENNKWAAVRSRQHLWNASAQLGFPTAMWRLPRQTEKHFLTSFSEIPQQTKIDFEELSAGFAFSPFINPDGTNALFLKADLHYIFTESEQSKNEELQEIIVPPSINPQFKDLLSALDSDAKYTNIATKQAIKTSEKQDFINLVERELLKLRQENFRKWCFREQKKWCYRLILR